MIACALTIILIAIFLSLIVLLRKRKYGKGKKMIMLIICFSIGLYLLYYIAMMLYFFLGDFSAEKLW